MSTSSTSTRPGAEGLLTWATAQVPVTLDDLVGQAELLSRRDRKYVLTPAGAGTALRALERTAAERCDLVAVLTGAAGVAARYESVYFDTPHLDAFHTTAYARRRRFKVRTRSYLDTGTQFLEVKTRSGRATTVKERVAITPLDSGHLDAAALTFVDARLRAAGITDIDPAGLRPVLRTSYRRVTVLQPDGRSRATVDLDLVWSNSSASYVPHGLAVLETKSERGTSPLDQELWRQGQRPQKISKFGTGMAVLDPQLPRNKWTRVLQAL